MIYDKWGVGKTPFTWDLACAVASGKPFLNLETIKTKVLYIEVDTPQPLVQKRLQPRFPELPEDIIWSFLYGKQFNVLSNSFSASEPYKEMVEIAAAFKPRLVIINTLRKVHAGEEIKGHIPNEVYQRFQFIFPHCSIVFVHHDRKNPTEVNHAPDAEAFSGHQAWLNDAQGGIHLVKTGQYVRVDHTKTQFSEELPSLVLEMNENATGFDVLKYKQSEQVQQFLASLDGKQHTMNVRELDKLIAKEIGKSERTARTIRLAIGQMGKKGIAQT